MRLQTLQTQTSLPPRPPKPPVRVATGAPEPNLRHQGTDVLYAMGMEPSTEFAGPRVLPTVPEAPPSKAPVSIEEGVIALDSPWARRLAFGMGAGLGIRFVATPIAGAFLSPEQEGYIASLPLGRLLTGYQPTPEQRRREVLASYI